MFLNREKNFTKTVEKFLEEADEKGKTYQGSESQIDVFVFFGNYRLVISKSVVARVYRLLIDGDVVLTIEKDLMGNEWVNNPQNISASKLKSMITMKKFAYNPNAKKEVTKLRISDEVV